MLYLDDVVTAVREAVQLTSMTRLAHVIAMDGDKMVVCEPHRMPSNAVMLERINPVTKAA